MRNYITIILSDPIFAPYSPWSMLQTFNQYNYWKVVPSKKEM